MIAALVCGATAGAAAESPRRVSISPGPRDWWTLEFGGWLSRYAFKLDEPSREQVIPSSGGEPTTLDRALGAPPGATILAYKFVSVPFLAPPLCADMPANWVAIHYPPQGTPVLAALSWLPGGRQSRICNLQPVQANRPEA